MVDSMAVARRRPVTDALGGLMTACDVRDPGFQSGATFTADLQNIREQIEIGAKYTPTALEPTSCSVRLRIAVSGPTLAVADESTRRAAAVALLAIAESALAEHSEYANLQAVSVAIIDPSVAGSERHTEEVVEFRQGFNQRLSEHTT